MKTMNTFVGRILRGLGMVGVVTALALMMIPTPMAAAKTGGGKVTGGGTLSIHIGGGHYSAGIEGAKVVVYGKDGLEAASGLSDAAGYFHAQLAIGSYRVVASAAGFEQAATTGSVQLGEVTKLALRLNAVAPPMQPPAHDTKTGRGGGALLVHATDDSPSGLVTGITGADVQIHTTQHGHLVAQGLTDAKGDYSVALDPGSYRVSVTANGYDLYKTPVTITMYEQVQVNALLKSSSAPPSPGNDMPRGGATLSVYALGNGTRTAGIAEATVKMYNEDLGGMMAEGLTDSKGKFSALVPPGRYTVYVAAAGYQDLKMSAKAVNNEETAVVAEMTLAGGPSPVPPPVETRPSTPGASILNIVVTDAGVDDVVIAEANVRIYSETGGHLAAQGLTDKLGKFSSALPTDLYVVAVSAPGYEEVEVLVQMPNPDTDVLPVRMSSIAGPAPDPIPHPDPAPDPIDPPPGM